jgi:hypothetical protein
MEARARLVADLFARGVDLKAALGDDSLFSARYRGRRIAVKMQRDDVEVFLETIDPAGLFDTNGSADEERYWLLVEQVFAEIDAGIEAGADEIFVGPHGVTRGGPITGGSSKPGDDLEWRIEPGAS